MAFSFVRAFRAGVAQRMGGMPFRGYPTASARLVEGERDQASLRAPLRAVAGIGAVGGRWRDDDDLVLADDAEHRAGPLVEHVGVEGVRAQEIGLVGEDLARAR